MRLRARSMAAVAIDMTPMIDIVFQLLVFFILTLQITSLEGDFNVRMPASFAGELPAAHQLPPLQVRLAAGENGALKSVMLNDQVLTDLDDLHRRIVALVGYDKRLAADAEVEIVSDYDLSYEHVIGAITAVSGERDKRGEVTKLIERIRFAQPPQARG